jgi:ABC-type lipoprotein export system ATPase subunit
MEVIRKYGAGKLLIMVTHDENDAEGADKILSF